MSLQDYAYIQTDLSPAQTLRYFFEKAENLWNKEYKEKELYGSKEDLFIVQAFPFSLADDLAVERTTELNIFPTVWLPFRLSKNAVQKAQDTILRGLLTMMNDTTGDMAYLEGGDDPVLIRKSQQVFLKFYDEFWTSERLKLIKLPYQFVEDPVASSKEAHG